jgi:uncharacterized protein GlcG (DUF336 family)
VVVVTPAFAADGNLPARKFVPITLATEAASVALAACTKQGYNVTVIVDDRHGDVRLMLVGDGVRNLNDVTKRKAYTSAIRATSSGDYAKFMASRPPGTPNAIPPDPNMIASQGGLPIMVDGDTIGSIAVGGAPGGDKDEACAAEGLAKIKDRLK